MKILQVITSLGMGGAEMLVAHMIPRLQALGHTVDLCVFDGEETVLMRKLRRESPQTKIYKLGHGVYNPIYILKLAHIMRQYDLVHTHNSSPQLFAALAGVLCSVELVSTEHTTSNRKRGWKWYRPIESWMYGRYKRVVCISKIAEEKLREYMKGPWLEPNSEKYGHILTINNGVDVEGIYRASPDADLMRQKGTRMAIVMVAGFRDAKDQDTLVRAMKLLPKNDFELWLVGIGVRQTTIKALANKLGVADRVRFLGLRTDIPHVLKAADIVVMSSHWEGLSLSNIEGMSAGKPFVASNVNGLREVTSGYGLLFEHEDEEELAHLIQRLHVDTAFYHQVADRCYRRAQQFDINKMVEGYEAIYRACLEKEAISC